MTVTNTGPRAGSDVVQVYVRDVESSVYRPEKELAGFAKVHLEPGASGEVVIRLDRRSFAVWDVAAHDWLVEAGAFEIVVARSSVDSVEVVKIAIDSGDLLGSATGPAAFVATDEEFVAMLGRPIPTPAPVRPFGRNSTLEDMESTRTGRVLASVVMREAVKRTAEEFPDPDDATIEMIRSSVREAPARSLVLMSGGMIAFAQLDTLIDALNGHWSAVGVQAYQQLRAALRH